MAWAQRLASGPTVALGRAKALIEAAQENDLSTQLELEARLVTEARDHWEAREGLNAFLEKRRPDFQGAARRATDEASD
jgi:2-(1,2-epoxy-1,2-dihydrophenyl)acetyl-CoA isomerase